MSGNYLEISNSAVSVQKAAFPTEKTLHMTLLFNSESADTFSITWMQTPYCIDLFLTWDSRQ